MTKENSIKKDLLLIYEELYNLFEKNKSSVFDKKFISRFKHSPEAIAEVLGILDKENAKEDNSKRSVKEPPTAHIKDLDGLREYYYEYLVKVFDHSIDDTEKNEILNSIRTNELKRLSSIISTVPLASKTTKRDILEMLRYYFNDESRTSSLVRGLKNP